MAGQRVAAGQPRELSEAEFTKIEDALIAQAPQGLSETEFNRWLNPRLEQAIGEAENTAPVAEGSAVGRFVSNAAEMLNPVEMVKGVYSAVRHPIDTATNLASAQVDQFRRAGQAFGEGGIAGTVEGMGRVAAGALPVLGPIAAQAGEQIGQGDVAGGLGKTAGILAPVGIRPAFNAVRGAAPARVAEALEEGAAARVVDVMAPKVGPNKHRFGRMAEQVAPEIAGDPSMAAWSREGLARRVADRLTDAEDALDAAAASRPNTRIPTQPIIAELFRQRAALAAPAGGGRQVALGPNQARVQMIEQAIEEIRRLGPTTTYEPLRRIRQAYDEPARAVYNPSVTQDFLRAQGGQRGAADVTGTLREALARADPQTAAANAQYSLWRRAHDVMEATAEVERTRPRVGRAIAARIAATMAGAKAGGTMGAVAGMAGGPLIESLLEGASTATKLQSARLMSRLADAIRNGNAGQVQTLTAQLQALARRTSPTTTAAAGRASTETAADPLQPAYR